MSLTAACCLSTGAAAAVAAAAGDFGCESSSLDRTQTVSAGSDTDLGPATTTTTARVTAAVRRLLRRPTRRGLKVHSQSGLKRIVGWEGAVRAKGREGDDRGLTDVDQRRNKFWNVKSMSILARMMMNMKC